MTAPGSTSKELAKGAGRFIGHVIAIGLGVVLMIAGVALGVTLVMLPIGIPLGLVGLGIFLWGIFGWSREQKMPTPPSNLSSEGARMNHPG